MEKIEVELHVDRKFDIEVEIGDVLDAINALPMKRRWNYIAFILNGCSVDLSDLTDDQKQIIKKYLNDKLTLF